MDDDTELDTTATPFSDNKLGEGTEQPIPLGYPGEYAGEYYERRKELLYERYETPEGSEEKLEIIKAPKLIMMEQLKTILYNLITDRPENVIDYFEEYVRYITTKDDILPPIINIFAHYFDAKILIEESEKWSTKQEEPETQAAEGEGGAALKKEYIFAERMDNFEDAGISITKLELMGVAIALQTVADNFPIKILRFWGKVLGLNKNYYILEGDITKELLLKESEEEQARKDEDLPEEIANIFEEAEEEEQRPQIKWHKIKKLAQYVKPPLPKSTYKPKKYAPIEKSGFGVNRKVYFASNEPTEGYIRLPDVTPEQIVKARLLKLFFTGEFEQEIISDPPFPGKEINFLRAQIARISAGSQLSPLGYYSFDLGEGALEEDEAEAEETEAGFKLPKAEFAVNPDFEPIPLQDLVDPSMSFWVHHAAHILPQGRAKWVDPTIDPNEPKPEGEDIRIKDKPIPEVGPPLLTSASDDMNIEVIPAWSTRLTMDLLPNNGAAYIKSNLWLGANTFGMHNDLMFDNVYVGWGHKHNADSYTPMPYFIPQKEYEIGPDVMEITDPDPEEEDYEGILLEQERLARKRAKNAEEAEVVAPTDEDI